MHALHAALRTCADRVYAGAVTDLTIDDATLSAAEHLFGAGTWLGPLHGIPYGAKDILDTAGITTGWGAEPFARRVPEADAEVIRRLTAAGAVLLGKTSVGALAYGEIWYGGRTRNPVEHRGRVARIERRFGFRHRRRSGRVGDRHGDAWFYCRARARCGASVCVPPSAGSPAPGPWRCAGRSTR